MKVCTDSSVTVTVNVMHQDQWVYGAQTVSHTFTHANFLLLINNARVFKRLLRNLIECYLVTDQRIEYSLPPSLASE